MTTLRPLSSLTFEIEAMAKAYIMDNLEDQLAEIRGEDDDD
jgi:hypothetical protein